MSLVKLSLPPRIKVLEALGAIADGRVNVIDDKRCRVVSSEGNRTYEVYVDLEKGLAYSNDNGTMYRSYIGYPIISFLMMKNVVPFDPDIAIKLKDIKWKILNENYKKYSLVEEHVKRLFTSRGGNIEMLEKLVAEVLRGLRNLTLYKLESPPKE
jgi:hypothetical protein